MRLLARVSIPLAALAVFVCAAPVAYAALVNINTASIELLETLPGIGPTKAAAIVAYRGAHGPFKVATDIQEVSGIGPATFAKLEALITVGTMAAVQPAAPPARSQGVQAVESAVSSTTTLPTHQDQAVQAPTVAVEPAAAGAAEPAASSLWHSGWVVGLLVVLAFAGAAFMIL